jgi:hypothetical protein
MSPTYREWCADLIAVPESARAEFIRQTLKPKQNLHFFGRYLFSRIVKGDYETPEIHLDLIKELSASKSSAILYPRGWAKTTWERIDTLHDIVYAIEADHLHRTYGFRGRPAFRRNPSGAGKQRAAKGNLRRFSPKGIRRQVEQHAHQDNQRRQPAWPGGRQGPGGERRGAAADKDYRGRRRDRRDGQVWYAEG